METSNKNIIVNKFKKLIEDIIRIKWTILIILILKRQWRTYDFVAFMFSLIWRPGSTFLKRNKKYIFSYQNQYIIAGEQEKKNDIATTNKTKMNWIILHYLIYLPSVKRVALKPGPIVSMGKFAIVTQHQQKFEINIFLTIY